MCGVTGAYFWDNAVDARMAESCVERMKDALRHRGPDGDGTWSATGAGGAAIALGHARLAIIDTSVDAAQPMRSQATGNCIAYNGETYNYADLRRELEAGGAAFRSRSDTEVVLHAYDTWGLAALERLRGMFAFGLWDAPNSRLVIARDRLGIKPLYYFAGDGFLLLASEVRALLASGLIPRTLDREGLWHYLGYQSLPTPRTLVEGVRMLPPASWLSVERDGRMSSGTYWDLLAWAAPVGCQARLNGTPTRLHPNADAALGIPGALRLGHRPPCPTENRDRLRALLRDAVASHLVSDVPVAAFLSGGIDSSSVVALMREAGIVPRTFCVGFLEKAFDEGAYAREVAVRFGCEHTEVRLDEDELLVLLPGALAAMDQPTGDGVNSYVVASAVRAHGIPVALSGLGGDEFFGGYPSFARLRRLAGAAAIWGRLPAGLRHVAGAGVRAMGGRSIGAEKTAAVVQSDGSLAALFPITRQVLSVDQRRALVAGDLVANVPDPYSAPLADAFSRIPGTGLMARVSYAEAATYMHDVLLRDTDQMSMAHALEVRVPLLDHRLVEHVMALTDECKSPAGGPKKLLIENLGVVLPTSVVNRRKRGFTLPFDIWMRGRLRHFCEERLGPDRLERRGIFRVNALRDLWTAFLAGRPGVTWSRVWLLVALDDWLERTQVAP